MEVLAEVQIPEVTSTESNVDEQKVKFTTTFDDNSKRDAFLVAITDDDTLNQYVSSTSDKMIEIVLPRSSMRSFERLRSREHRKAFAIRQAPTNTISEYL